MSRRLRHSFLSLLLTQGGQYLASLIILPILTRRLGLDGYGELGLCLAIIGYLGLVVEWGYSATATKQIAIVKDDLVERSRVFWSVFWGKCALLVLSAAALWGFLQSGWLAMGNHILLWMCFITVMANGLSPNFFYHGLERLDFPFGVNLISRFLSIPVILILVQAPSDVATAQGTISVALLVATITNLLYLKRLKLICWVSPSLSQLLVCMKTAAPLFVSTAILGVFYNSLTVILGYTSGTASVGAFTAALNLYRAAQGMFLPLSQTVYPRLSYLFCHDKTEGVRMLKRVFKLLVPVTAVVCLLLAWGAQWALPMLIGQQFDASVTLFQLFTVALFLFGLSSLIGAQVMVLLNRHVMYTKIVTLSVFGSLIAAYIMNLLWGAAGSALAVIACEVSVVIGCLASLQKDWVQAFGITRNEVS